MSGLDQIRNTIRAHVARSMQGIIPANGEPDAEQLIRQFEQAVRRDERARIWEDQ